MGFLYGRVDMNAKLTTILNFITVINNLVPLKLNVKLQNIKQG